MKLSITDKFLWGLYYGLEAIDDTMEFLHLRVHTMADVAPLDYRELKRRYEKEKARKSFSEFIFSLGKRGYIKIKNLEGSKAIILEKKGLEKILKTRFKNLNLKKRKDGKCLMLIFDIPENKRKMRDLLREMLYNLGYKMLQKSVWISPYDVQQETEFFLRRNNLSRYAKLFLIEEAKI
jgi:hypothetical protein